MEPTTETELLRNLLALMKQQGFAPELIYAFGKTRRFITEDNLHLFSADERAEWTAAIREYLDTH